MGMIQIRNVPDELHRKLKAKAAHEGKTLSDLLLAELPRIAHRVTMREMLERIAQREAVPGLTPARIAEGKRDLQHLAPAAPDREAPGPGPALTHGGHDLGRRLPGQRGHGDLREVAAHGLTGLIVSNTTVSRPPLRSAHREEAGGL